jgi:hypothetical protein
MTTKTKKTKAAPLPKTKKQEHRSRTGSLDGRTEHVAWRPPSTLLCRHCSQHYEIAMPALVDIVTATMDVFIKHHKSCKLTDKGLACPFCYEFGHDTDSCPMTKYQGSYQKWLEGPDTGLSSRAIGRKLSGGIPPKPGRNNVALEGWEPPRDADDFGRCHRLLHAIPGWRKRIGEMATVPGWEGLAQHWDELEALYLAKSYRDLYERIKVLRASP